MTDHVTQPGELVAEFLAFAAFLGRAPENPPMHLLEVSVRSIRAVADEVTRLSAELAARSGGWEEWYERGFQTAKDGAEKLARERVGAAPMSRGEVLICDNIASAISSMEAPSHD